MTYSGAKNQKVCNKHWKGARNDIRFTRRKLSRPWRSCCAALAALLLFLLLTTLTLYLGHIYIFREPLNRQTFRGVFRVTNPEWGPGDTHPSSAYYKQKELMFQDAINSLYRSSDLRGSFSGNEILALDSSGEDTTVHFDVYFDPIFTSVTADEVRDEFERGLNNSGIFSNMKLEGFRLETDESMMLPRYIPVTVPATEEPITKPEPPLPRTCVPVTLGLCSHLPYNFTSYPNLVGHIDFTEIERELVAFRELLDAECSHLARDFVCRVLQPECVDKEINWPCRSYCKQFHDGCGSRLPDKLQAAFDCERYPELIESSSCEAAPECKESLQQKSLWGRICDGTADCVDAADERSCPFCPYGGKLCARNALCVMPEQICDGVPDCPDGSDEISCLWVSESLRSWSRRILTIGAVREHYGDAVWAERGRYGKVCAASIQNKPNEMDSIAASLCKSLTFDHFTSVEIVNDTESTQEYADIIKEEDQVSFTSTTCPSKKVLRVSCAGLKCGLQAARGNDMNRGVDGLSRSAKPGDWPWHVALYRDGAHVCDGVLINLDWIITTSFCFQGQGKSSWVAKAGIIRASSHTPWQQERRIIGMLRSPVEGSTVALLRLHEPMIPTDFVRHICLSDGKISENSTCGALSWSRDQLRRIQLSIVPPDACSNVSVPLEHALCAGAVFDEDDCDEEEFAGSSMICFDGEKSQWTLEGVSVWRIACRTIGRGRPRLYDAISANVKWINQAILSANLT